jgi:hypothetical protein
VSAETVQLLSDGRRFRQRCCGHCCRKIPRRWPWIADRVRKIHSRQTRLLRLLKLKRLPKVMQIRGVRVYAHWSVLLVGTVILFGAFERPAETLAAWTAYYSVILIHECGYTVAAHRKGCHVTAIELYPITVACASSTAVPIRRCCDRLGRSRNAGCGCGAAGNVCRHFRVHALRSSQCGHRHPRLLQPDRCGVHNLVPVRPLDGAKAWYLIPD